MDELYKQRLIDHHKNPRNKGKIDDADVEKKDKNPMCGDVVEMYLQIDDGTVKNVAFEGKGCVICLATSSILTEEFMDKDVTDIVDMDKDDVMDIIGIDLETTRIKCATLPLLATKKGILENDALESYLQNTED